MEERERQFIPGLGTLVLTILLLGAVGALLHDFNGVGFGAVGALIWGGAVLVTFVLGTAYLSRRLLPLQGNQGWSEGFRLLWRNYMRGAANLLYGRPKEPPAISGKKKKTQKSELAPSFGIIRAGFLFSHEAAAITRGNSYSRADGPGLVFLHGGESITQVFDLRTQSRKMPVSAVTRDGIPVETSVSVSFQVRRPAANQRRPRSIESDAIPYPYDRDALFDLTYTGSVADDDKRDWREQVCPQAATLLVTEIGKYPLDELLVSGGSEPMGVIKDRIKSRLKDLQGDDDLQMQTLPRGIDILGVGIGPLALPEDVTDKRLETWQVEWKSRIQQQQISGGIESQRLFQEARARAQVENIEKLLLSIDAMRRQSGFELQDVVMLRLIEILEATMAGQAMEQVDIRPAMAGLVAEATSELRQALGRGDDSPT